MKRASLVGLALVAAACSRPAPPTAPVTPLFCAFGGVGIVPDPLPAGYDTAFATAVVDVTSTGASTSPVSVTDLTLLDPKGGVAASTKRVVAVVVLPSGPAPAPHSAGSWAFYLNPAGTPFTGTLGSGTTRLRVRVALDRPAMEVARFRLTLSGFSTPVVVEGPVDGAWGT